MPDTLRLTSSWSVTIKSSTPEALEVEASYGPGGSAPPKHYHPSRDEHFEVSSGAVRVCIEGKERALEPGETVDVPRGTGRNRGHSCLDHHMGGQDRNVERDRSPSPTRHWRFWARSGGCAATR
jgi:Cupin domain